MLSTEERIKLRDVIFNKLLAIPVIYKSKKSYRVNNMKTFMNAINSDMELSKQYKLYPNFYE